METGLRFSDLKKINKIFTRNNHLAS